MDFDSDPVTAGGDIHDLSASGSFWLAHIVRCLETLASQRGINISIKHAFCESGILRIVAETDSNDAADKLAVQRIVRTGCHAQRLLEAGCISAADMERIRKAPVCVGAYIDPEIRGFWGDWLVILASRLGGLDPFGAEMAVVAVYGLLGGTGPLVVEIAMADEALRHKIAFVVSGVNRESEKFLIPRFEWREYLRK